MDEVEQNLLERIKRENMVAEAAIMERAAAVWMCRRPRGVASRVISEEIAFKLRARAAELRREAESGG